MKGKPKGGKREGSGAKKKFRGGKSYSWWLYPEQARLVTAFVADLKGKESGADAPQG